MKLSFQKRLSLILMCVVMFFSSFLFTGCVETTYVPKGRTIFLYNTVDTTVAANRMESQYSYFTSLAQKMLESLYDTYGPTKNSTPIDEYLDIALGGDVMNALPTMNYVNYIDFTLYYENLTSGEQTSRQYHIFALSVDLFPQDSICSREEEGKSTRFTIKPQEQFDGRYDTLFWTGSNEFAETYFYGPTGTIVNENESSNDVLDVFNGYVENYEAVIFIEFDSNNQICAIYFIGSSSAYGDNNYSIETQAGAYNIVRELYSKYVLGNTYVAYKDVRDLNINGSSATIIAYQWKHPVSKEAINSRHEAYGASSAPTEGFDEESKKFYLDPSYSSYLAALLAKAYVLGDEECSSTTKTIVYYDKNGTTTVNDLSLLDIYDVMVENPSQVTSGRIISDIFFKCLMSNKRNLNNVFSDEVKTRFASVLRDEVIGVADEIESGAHYRAYASACSEAVTYAFENTKFMYADEEKSLDEFTFPDEFIMHSSKVYSFMETDSLDVSNADIGAYSYLSSLILYSYPKDIEVEVDKDVFDESDPKERKEKKELIDEARKNAENDFAPMTLAKISLTATLADTSADYSELEDATILLIVRNGENITTQAFSLSKTSTEGEYALDLENNIGSIKSKKDAQPLTKKQDDKKGEQPGEGSDDDLVKLKESGVISDISNNIFWAGYGYGQYYTCIDEEESYAQLVFLSKEDNGPLAVKITSLEVLFRS